MTGNWKMRHEDPRDKRMLVLFLFAVLLLLWDLALPLVPDRTVPSPMPQEWSTGQGGALHLDPRTCFFLGMPMEINRAKAQDLKLIPGIGPGLAEKIIAYRSAHGCIHDLEELQQVRGIGKKLASRMSSQIRFDCP